MIVIHKMEKINKKYNLIKKFINFKIFLEYNISILIFYYVI